MTDAPTAREGDSAWARLRRRKVVQWGIAYAAGAYVLLQALEYFSGTSDWPRQIQQLTTVALLVGLPVALILAWYHGDRAQQGIASAPELRDAQGRRTPGSRRPTESSRPNRVHTKKGRT